MEYLTTGDIEDILKILVVNLTTINCEENKKEYLNSLDLIDKLNKELKKGI